MVVMNSLALCLGPLPLMVSLEWGYLTESHPWIHHLKDNGYHYTCDLLVDNNHGTGLAVIKLIYYFLPLNLTITTV